MQCENREFANKMSVACKFSNLISGKHCFTITYIEFHIFNTLFHRKNQRENQGKYKGTISAFSKYLRILGEVS